MQTGVIKKFFKEKGFGFIKPDEGGDDVFVHYRQIETDGVTTLKEGQRVSFIRAASVKGDYATNVTLSERVK